jgi:hypothetical protein
VAGQVGLGHTRCPTKGGLTTARVVQAEANFGTGPGAVGASVQVDPNNGVAVQRTGRIGVGGGAMVAAGVSQVVTIASPPILGGRNCGCP